MYIVYKIINYIHKFNNFQMTSVFKKKQFNKSYNYAIYYYSIAYNTLYRECNFRRYIKQYILHKIYNILI